MNEPTQRIDSSEAGREPFYHLILLKTISDCTSPGGCAMNSQGSKYRLQCFCT